MSGKRVNRMDKITKILAAETGVSVKELAALLRVSEITVRRDLRTLEEDGSVKLINGVAICRTHTEGRSTLPEYDLEHECTVFREKKQRIADKALSLIEPNDVIALDAGSTADYLARALPRDVNLTVLAYSLNVLTHLSDRPNCDVICAGGYLYANTRMFYSPEGISLISRTCANKAFISAAGVSGKFNVTCIVPHEMNAKCALMECSQTKVLMLDSTKFGKICPTTFAHLSNFDVIITDDELGVEWRGEIAALGITLYLV